VLRRLLDYLRLGTRTLAFVAMTVIAWICMELELLVSRQCRRIDLVNRWVARWANLSLWIYNMRVEARGPHLENGRLYPAAGPDGVGRVFVANHRSGIDIPILLSVVEAHPISRHDLASWPLLGRCAKRVGTLFVDRDSRRSGASVLKEVARTLAASEGVLMFPEGTSYPDDEVREFRPGAMNAARRAGAQIVPLGIAYGHEAAYYYRESFLTHIVRVGKLPRLRVAVEVGHPLTTDQLTPVKTIALAREQVQMLVHQARARLDQQKMDG
jgi:1-acyl-sn-glycerol-3-phosphate acyltransferase